MGCESAWDARRAREYRKAARGPSPGSRSTSNLAQPRFTSLEAKAGLCLFLTSVVESVHCYDNVTYL